MVLAGPSAVGKGTVVRGLLEREPGLWFSVSANTRARRPGEQDGVDYIFLSRGDFEALRDAGGFLEWFEVYGDLKGTPRAPVEEHLAAGDDVLLEIDVQGALKVREVLPQAVLVFLKAPSAQEQRRRIEARGDADPADVERRLRAAAAEEARAGAFDHVVVNDDVGTAVAEVAGILAARRSA
jgi:guanylate kinase